MYIGFFAFRLPDFYFMHALESSKESFDTYPHARIEKL